MLREELEKEEFYVEYLERLLSDVEEHKKKIGKEKAEPGEFNDLRADKLSKVSAEREAQCRLISWCLRSRRGSFVLKESIIPFAGRG